MIVLLALALVAQASDDERLFAAEKLPSQSKLDLAREIVQKEAANPTSVRALLARTLELRALTDLNDVGAVVRKAPSVAEASKVSADLAYGAFADLYLAWANQRLDRFDELSRVTLRMMASYDRAKAAKPDFHAKLPSWLPTEISLVNLLAIAEDKQRRYDSAILAFRRALTLDTTDQGQAMLRANMATSELAAGRPDDAEKSGQAALEQARKAKSFAGICFSAKTLGFIRGKMGYRDQARALFQEAIDACGQTPLFRTEKLALTGDLAWELIQIGKPEEAAARIQASLEDAKGLIEQASGEERRDLLASLFALYRAAAEAHAKMGQTEKMYETLATSRAGYLTDKLGSRSGILGTKQSLQEVQQSLQNDEAILAFPRGGTAVRSALVIRKQSARAVDLASEAIRDPTPHVLSMANGFRVNLVLPGSPAASADVKAGDFVERVDGKPWFTIEALIAYMRPSETLEVTLRRDGKTIQTTWKKPSNAPFGIRLQSSGEGQITLPLVGRRVAQTLGSPTDATRGLQKKQVEPSAGDLRWDLRFLYDTHVRPLEKDLEGVRRIYLYSDGGFADIPFDALLDSAGKALVERYEIRHLVSLNLRNQLEKRVYSADRKPLLALGGAIYKKASYAEDMLTEGQVTVATLSRGGNVTPTNLGQAYAALGFEFENLPGTLREVQSIAGSLPGSLVLTGKDASETQMKRMSKTGELQRFKTIHLAVHGAIIPAANELSAVVLSTPDDGAEDDGYLRAAEIEALQLEADAVVLSACETAKGQIIEGEGTVGLVQSLILAGANGVVVSLWPVSDEATAVLMTRTYALMAEQKLALPTALSLAKRELVSGKLGSLFMHPHFWAPFVYFGL